MNKENSKLVIGTVLIFQIILISTAISSIISRKWGILGLSLLAIVSLIIPFIIKYIADKKKIMLPYNFRLVMIIFIFLAQYLGEIKKFYHILWWWDSFLHCIFGIYAVIIALDLIKGIIKKDQETNNQRFTFFTVAFAFTFSVTLGTLWEIFEFLGDYLLKSNMVKGGLQDTLMDLIVKSSGALITCIIFYYRNLKKIKS